MPGNEEDLKKRYSEFGYMRAADGHTWRPLDGEPRNSRLAPGRESIRVGIKPECEGCNMGAHGFLCHFQDGSCLKLQALKGGLPDAVGNRGNDRQSQTG